MTSERVLKMMSFIDKRIFSIAFLAFVVSGCANVGPTQYEKMDVSVSEKEIITSKPYYLQGEYTRFFEEGSRNQVLNLMVIGKTAFDNNDLEEAAIAFDNAIAKVEEVYSDSDSATKARSLWYEEGSKDFKGEPYERSLLYYYRGLIYLAEEDFENARASFLNSIMQDAFAEEEQYRSDFGSQLFLVGWSSRKMGSESLAKQAFDELATIAPGFIPPDPKDDILIIAESGTSPRKLADGVGHHQLVYRRGKKIIDNQVELVDGDGKTLKLETREDIFWQASSRGGRQIDRIIDGQVSFKETTADIGKALSSIGTAAIYLSAPFEGAGNIGSGFALVGVGMMAISANAKVRADTRNWDNIPNLLHFATASTENIAIDGSEFRFLDEAGNQTHAQSPNLVVKGNKQVLIWSNGEKHD